MQHRQATVRRKLNIFNRLPIAVKERRKLGLLSVKIAKASQLCLNQWGQLANLPPQHFFHVWPLNILVENWAFKGDVLGYM